LQYQYNTLTFTFFLSFTTCFIVYVSENEIMLHRKLFRKYRHSKKLKDRETCYTLILVILVYIGTILWIYLQDLPRFGGTNRTCKRFHYTPPESSKSNSTYPFPNTFSIGRQFDWSGSNTPHAWQNFQQLGTHNSYHRLNQAGRGTFWASWFMVFPLFPWAKELAYEHPSLEEQLEKGYRTFELDLHLRDDGVMNYHLQMWDQQTHCYCFSTCLQKLKRWSLENPNHSPVVIMMEPKDMPGGEDSYTINNEIELTDILAVEQEILNVIGSDSLITPDSIRESDKSLSESLKTRGWPSIYDMKSTFMFAWWDGSEIRNKYESGTNGLKGRLIFTIKYVSDWAYPETHNDNRILIHGDNPRGNSEWVKEIIESNLLIRSRANSVSDTSLDQGTTENSKAISEYGQQVVSADVFFEEVWEGMLVDCKEIDDISGKVCIRE